MCALSEKAGRCHFRACTTNIGRSRIRPGWRPVWYRPCFITMRLSPSSPWSSSNRISSKGLISGICYPRFVDHITTFLARTLFLSSDLAVPAAQKKEGIAAFSGNHALCKITEDLIFTDPYFQAEQNRWTSPWLDATVASFREDLDLHVAISRLKLKFM